VTWDEIEPYYDQFENIYGVGGKAGNLEGEIQAGGNPHEGPRSARVSESPDAPHSARRNLCESRKRAWLRPLPGPAAAMTRDYKNLYKVMMLECHRGGYCSSHVCAQGAKANPLSAVLPALYKQKTFELRALCNVIKVNTDSTGKQVTSVTYIDARGGEIEQPAGIVVLASYCFNNTRLLLLSGIGKPYDPQTGRGIVGPQLLLSDRRPGARLLR
jgi:gluconate 2-dehydrogenase alpha chain